MSTRRLIKPRLATPFAVSSPHQASSDVTSIIIAPGERHRQTCRQHSLARAPASNKRPGAGPVRSDTSMLNPVLAAAAGGEGSSIRCGPRRHLQGSAARHCYRRPLISGSSYRRFRCAANARLRETITVTLPPSLIAAMSATVMRSSTSDMASRTLVIVKRTAQAFTLLQSGQG
jgi:hypothetical protein